MAHSQSAIGFEGKNVIGVRVTLGVFSPSHHIIILFMLSHKYLAIMATQMWAGLSGRDTASFSSTNNSLMSHENLSTYIVGSNLLNHQSRKSQDLQLCSESNF